MLPRLADRAFNNAFLLLSLMALFWAGNQVLGRAVAGHVPPVALSFVRWSLASLIVLPFAWPHLRRDWPAVRANWRFLAFLGVVGGGAFNTLQYIGLNYTTALNSLVLNSTGPILIAIACVILFRDRLTATQISGTLLSMAGVLVVVSRGEVELLSTLSLNRGDLLILFAMAITGVYTACLRLRPEIHWITFLFCQFLASGLFNAPLVLIEALAFGKTLQPTLFTVLAIGYVAIFPSILAYICFTRGVELIGGVRAGIFLHLIPFFGALLAIGLLGEPLAGFHVLGFVLILSGVALTSRKP
ncbi:MAG: DMT family transporter [Hyphomicrobiaceae bacterium]|nr:DMT family transporter [Hyphomicrobiaceae bacterium]